MTEKEIVLETIRALPDDCSLEEIAERIEFMAAVQKGLDQIDRGESIPHDEVKKQYLSAISNRLPCRSLASALRSRRTSVISALRIEIASIKTQRSQR